MTPSTRSLRSSSVPSEQEEGSRPSRASKRVRGQRTSDIDGEYDEDKKKGGNSSPPTKKQSRTRKKAKQTEDAEPVSKRKKSPGHQRITERGVLHKLWNPEDLPSGSYCFKIVSWNVAGLRALMRKLPNALSDLVREHDIDVLCLQETKLQEMHLDDPKLKIRGHVLENEGYDAYYSCSTARKGYAGTAVFVKRRDDGLSDLMPTEVSFEMGRDEHDAEGRIISLDFPAFSLTNVYVPNSGQNLDRLSYRTDSWDKHFLEFMQQKQRESEASVMWVGDLNVAHTAKDVWNDGAKHLAKQAGVTPEERASFQAQLDSGFIDVFRKLHPDAWGQYSYWSQRAGNREPNKGLRLDYFICSPSFFDESQKAVVRDSYMLFEQQGSDHCPVVLEMEIKL